MIPALQQKRKRLGVDHTKKPEEAVNNLLYNTPKAEERGHRHILQALVTDEPGVLRYGPLLSKSSFSSLSFNRFSCFRVVF